MVSAREPTIESIDNCVPIWDQFDGNYNIKAKEIQTQILKTTFPKR